MSHTAPPRVLIVGGDSMIGKTLARRLRADGSDVTCTSRKPGGGGLYLDLAAMDDAVGVTEGCDCMVLAAAVTGRAACQADPERAAAMNVVAPVDLARPVLARGGHVVFLSTHAVLGGAVPFLPEDAPYDPPDLYSEQKVSAEQQLLGLDGASGLTVVRPTKVLSRHAGLINAWANAIAQGDVIDVYSDLVMAPIGVGHVVDRLAGVINRRQPGVVHLSGAAEVSYADFAAALATRLGWPAGLINVLEGRPVNPIAAITPAHASLAANDPQGTEDVLTELTVDAP